MLGSLDREGITITTITTPTPEVFSVEDMVVCCLTHQGRALFYTAVKEE